MFDPAGVERSESADDVAVTIPATTRGRNRERFTAIRPRIPQRLCDPRLWAGEQRPVSTNKNKSRCFCNRRQSVAKKSTNDLIVGCRGRVPPQGGILQYLKKSRKSKSSWQGELLCFDNRVTWPRRKKARMTLCHGCRRPILPRNHNQSGVRAGVSCPHCRPINSDADKGAVT